MTKRIVVVSAGLSVPSSTRLLADRLGRRRRRRRSRPAGSAVEVEIVELRPLAHALADHLLTGFPTGELAEAIEKVRRADGLVVVTPVFSASYSGLFKTFVDVLEPGRPRRQAGPDRRHRRHGPALAGARPRAPAAVLLPARRRRADRRLRGQRGLRQHRRGPPGQADPAGGRRARRAPRRLTTATPSRPPRSGGPSRTSSPTRRRSRSCSAAPAEARAPRARL